MLNWFGRFILAATALAPIALVYSWAAAVQKQYWVAAGLFASAPLLLLLCVRLIRNAQNGLERSHINPTAAEATDRENMAKRVLDLSASYREATDQDIVALCNLPRLTGNPNEIISVANPTLRKLISSVKDSDVFANNTADEIQAKAHAVNLNLLVQNHRVVLPSEKAELRKVLTFLDHGVYLSPVSNERYITNSRRALP